MNWQRHIPWKAILAGTVLAGLAARLAWVASHTETGWETIAADWHAATIGRIVGYRLPVAQRDQRGQNDFWLTEIDRILAREPHTPELLQGAVRMLGAYNGDYNLPLAADLVAVPDLDVYDGPGGRGYDPRGEQRRRAKQLQLAAQATAEFPESLAAWQTRAEVCAQPFGASEDPRNAEDWQKFVNECRRHDPDNSFYNFLIAGRLLWEANNTVAADESAASNSNSPAAEVLQDHQRKEIELEDAAVAEVKSGLKLPKFEWPNSPAPGRKFIERTCLPVVEKAHLIAWSDNYNYVFSILPNQVVEIASRLESRAPGTDTKDLRRMAIAICESYSPQPFTDPFQRWREARFRAEQWKQWSDYLQRDLDASPSGEAVQARTKAIDLEVQARQWTSLISSWGRRQVFSRFENTWIGFIAWKAAALAVQLLLIACLTVAMWQILRLAFSKNNNVGNDRLGILRQLAAWFAALVASVILFAMAPAEVISHSIQGWVATIEFVLAMIALPIVVAVRLGGQISMRMLLALVFAYALIFTSLSWWDAIEGDRPLRKFPPAVWIPARGAGGMSAEQLEAKLTRAGRRSKLPASELRWPAVQFVLYHGAEWTIAVALVGIGLWWWMRANRQRKRAALPMGTSHGRRASLLPGLFRALARSALGAAGVALAVYLALAPERIEHFEAIYRFESQQVRNANADAAGLQKQFDELMADEQSVSALRHQVEHEFSQPPDTQ